MGEQNGGEMTIFTLDETYTDLAGVTEWYVAHDKQKGTIWRKNVPEVFHFDQMAPTVLTRAWQEFIYELNNGGKPGWMTPGSFHGMFRWNKAFSNRSAGFDWPTIPHADYIKKTNLKATPPRLDKCRICGGATIRGKLQGDLLIVETLDGKKPPPTVAWLRAHPWLMFRCYTVLPNGANANFPQCGGNPVYMPLVASGSISVQVGMNIPDKPYPLVTPKRA